MTVLPPWFNYQNMAGHFVPRRRQCAAMMEPETPVDRLGRPLRRSDASVAARAAPRPIPPSGSLGNDAVVSAPITKTVNPSGLNAKNNLRGTTHHGAQH